MRRVAIAIACAFAGLACARDARAQAALGLDANGVVHDSRDRGFGAGLDARVGFRFGWPRGWFLERAFLGQAIFQIEAIAGNRSVPAFTSAQDDLRIGRLAGGLRLGYSGLPLFEPFVFFHAGAARTGDGDTLAMWDLGAAFDYRFSAASIGVHATFDRLEHNGGWVEIGPHFELRWLLF